MKSLCTEDTDQTALLKKLSDWVDDKTLSGTHAWSLFSWPEGAEVKGFDGAPYKIKDKGDQEILRAIKEKVKANLYKRFSGACAYCRRPVAHYHYGWQIEHVEAKSFHPDKTFLLNNLAVACIECNSWKGHLDKKAAGKALTIVNPRQKDFVYSKHLRFLSVTMDRLSFASYERVSPEGIATYKDLRFHEIERAVILDSVDVGKATLHARMDRLIAIARAAPEASELADLLSALKSALYAQPVPSKK